MSNYYYGPALDSEISYRRDSLIRDAAVTRLARQARPSPPGGQPHGSAGPAGAGSRRGPGRDAGGGRCQPGPA